MTPNTTNQPPISLTLCPVDRTNWRAITKLAVTPAQRDFVAEPCYYLALCAYDNIWQPLAISLADQVIGFLMWTVDPADASCCWLGGILIDQHYQGRGYGRQAIQVALAQLRAQGHQAFALSYQPTNTVAKQLYASLGFIETAEWEDDEIVARLVIA